MTHAWDDRGGQAAVHENALRALARRAAHFDPQARVNSGGLVSEVSPSFFRIQGLCAGVAVGDRVRIDEPPGLQGEIIHVDRSGSLAKAYAAAALPAIGQRAFRIGPRRLRPDAAWLGRVVNALGEPIDGAGPLPQGDPVAIDAAPPAALTRQRIEAPLRSGVRAIDLFTPLAFGQRIGVFAGSGVGKSTLMGMLARASGFDAVVVGLIGERGREVREFIEDALGPNRSRAAIVVATGDESALMRRLAARSAMAVAEYFRDRGQRVLLMIDSVTRYAQAAREIAISAGEPPVARGFPPNVFADLPQLLERAGPGASGAGSITGLFTVLVDGDDHNDPVADAIRGTLDGHIVLDRAIAAQGRYPAVDILKSLSRLSQLSWTPQQRELVGKLVALAARFEETRDFRAMGGYSPGADAELDSAVSLVPRLYAGLKQLPEQPASADAFAEIAEFLRG